MPVAHPSPIRHRRVVASPDAVLLREVAAFLVVHPSGAVMARLTGAPSEALLEVLRGERDRLPDGARLGRLGEFVTAAQRILARRGRDPFAPGPYQQWLREGSVPIAGGALRPLDALAHPALVDAAIAELEGLAA